MLVIGFLNQKGGVGKTTLAIAIAAALTAMGYRVLLIDADPQGSALDWAAAREGEPLFSVVGLPRPTIHKEMAKLGAGYDIVVIDGPPRVTDLARSAILASDIVIVPVQPSPYDIWAAEEIIKLIDEARIYKENLKACFAINRKIANTAIARDVGEALAGYLFATQKGGAYAKSGLSSMWDRAKERIGMKDDVTFKDIRSLGATDAARRGDDRKAIQTRLAHTSGKTTDIYIKEAIPDVSAIENLPWDAAG